MTQLCVIFDIDGTLCDTSDVDDVCYRYAAAAALKVSPSEIDWTGAPHHTDSGIARWLWERFRARSPSREELDRLRDDFLRRLEAERVADANRFRPVRAAPQFLDGLRRVAPILGIGTGGWRVSAEFKLGAAGIDPGLLYATADDAESRAEIFSLAWTRASADSERPRATILVGDSVWDVATARKLGWRFLGVGTGAAAGRLHRAGAAVVVPDYVGPDAIEAIQRAQVPDEFGLRRAAPLM
jgi:phosphoglycolate phosphatase-like HAD superfamily hydrolase